MAALNGKWKLVSVDNFVPYLDAVDVQGEFREKALKLLTPENNITQDITIDGDAITIVTTTPISPIEVKATNKQEFQSRYLDGREIKTVFTVEGDTLKEEVSGPFSTTILRALEGAEMVMTMKSGDVTSTRRYQKV
ncbi:sodium/calcium exchanger regulatory protein 1-like [Babylonia areolata]|uniref:sodium/calcium exchanger regulatory protein 1-like n=1 Tax=Babylonia areolata TaxID=304850 RepID=UPI003FD2FEA4